MFIPDPNFFHPWSEFFLSRIPDPHKRIKYFLPKKMVSKLSEIWFGFFFPDPDFLPITDPEHWFNYIFMPRCASFIVKSDPGWFDLDCESYLTTICETDPLWGSSVTPNEARTNPKIDINKLQPALGLCRQLINLWFFSLFAYFVSAENTKN